MNRERAKELLPIIEAFANGEKVEYRRLQCGDKPWEQLGENWYLHKLSDDAENFEYRIKPSPREFWINMYKTIGYVHNSIDEADARAGETRLSLIKVREVL